MDDSETPHVFTLKVPADFSTVTDDDLTDLETQAREAAKPLLPRAKADAVEPLDDEGRQTLRQLADVVTKVKTERTRRVAAHAAATADAKADADAAAAFANDPPSRRDSEPARSSTANWRSGESLSEMVKSAPLLRCNSITGVRMNCPLAPSRGYRPNALLAAVATSSRLS